jgi:hypothetical protein
MVSAGKAEARGYDRLPSSCSQSWPLDCLPAKMDTLLKLQRVATSGKQLLFECHSLTQRPDTDSSTDAQE